MSKRFVLGFAALAVALEGRAGPPAWRFHNISESLPTVVFFQSDRSPDAGSGGVAWIANWSAIKALAFYDRSFSFYITPTPVPAPPLSPLGAPWWDVGPKSACLWGSAIAFCASSLGTLHVTSEEIFYWEAGTIHRITYDNSSDVCPSLYERTIAWQSRAGNGTDDWEIRYWDGYGVRPITDNDVDDTEPSLYERTIAWRSGSDIVYLSVPSDIYAGTLPGPVVVAPGERPCLFKNEIAYHASDGHDTEIFIYNIDSGEIVQITNNEYDDRNPSLYNGTVAWEGFDGHDWEIFYWDGKAAQELTHNDVDDTEPSLWGTGLNTTIAYVGWQTPPFLTYFQSCIILARPAVTVTAGPAIGEITVSWPSLEGRMYRVEYSEDLANWEVAADFVPSAGYGTTSWTDGKGSGTVPSPSAVSLRFYRVCEVE